MRQLILAIMICTATLGVNAQTVVKGTRVPQLTTQQRNTISSVDLVNAKGQVIYNLDNNCLEYWNGVKWVSLCLGTANITLTPNDPSCAYDPNKLVPASGSTDNCIYTPKDEPACVVPSGQAYQVYLTAGESYTSLYVDALTSAFSVVFQPNNSSRNRIAVVRVVNNCSGEFQDFIFTQTGATCPAAANPTVTSLSSQLCQGGSTYAYVNSPATGMDYVWEYGSVIVYTGNLMEITRAGEYKVYAGLQGCGTPAVLDISATTDNSSAPTSITASNSGILCGSNSITLTANNQPSGTEIVWFKNGVWDATRTNPRDVSGASSAGDWFGVVRNTSTGCLSASSNHVQLIDQTSQTSIAKPVATINSTSLSGSLTICKSGSLELKVTNSNVYPANSTYEWFDNGVSIYKGTSPIFYYNVPSNKTSMTLSVKVNDNNGACPNTATSSATNVTLTAPAATNVNNGLSTAAICGSNATILQAGNASGASYEWFKDGSLIAGANASGYQTTQEGNYSVRVKDAQNCWSVISIAINVKQSAAITMNWLTDPVSPVVIGDNKSYTVNASPAPDSYRWTSSNPAVAVINPIGNGQTAAVNYPALGKSTIKVEATNTCGTVSLSKEIEAGTGCTPITSVSLTPTGTINKFVDANGTPKSGNGQTQLTATANNGSATNMSYTWYINGVSVGEFWTTYLFTTPSSEGDYRIKAKIKNGCSEMETNETTIHMVKDYPVDNSGSFRLSGKVCFDVKRTNDNAECGYHVSRVNDFASTKEFSYTFNSTNSSSYSNLTFEVMDNNALLESYSYTGNKLTVRFKDNIGDLATGVTKQNPLTLAVIARYNSGGNKQLSLTLSVQDCSCGCSVKSNLSSGNGWLTFMCYNLGAQENMTIDAQTRYSPTSRTTDATVLGDMYQWGRVADGHEKRTSKKYLGQIAKSEMENDQVAATSDAYGKFVYTNDQDKSDWRITAKLTLWAVPKTTYDPCPPGWRVPTKEEWLSIVGADDYEFPGNTDITTYKQVGSLNYWKWNPQANGTGGYFISPDGINPTMFLPFAASRNYMDGQVGYGDVGYYWAAASGGKYGFFWIEHTYRHYLKVMNSSTTSAYGRSVRCIAE